MVSSSFYILFSGVFTTLLMLEFYQEYTDCTYNVSLKPFYKLYITCKFKTFQDIYTHLH